MSQKSSDTFGDKKVANLEQKIQSILKLRSSKLPLKGHNTSNSHKRGKYGSFPDGLDQIEHQKDTDQKIKLFKK